MGLFGDGFSRWSWTGKRLSGETRRVLILGAVLEDEVGVLWGELLDTKAFLEGEKHVVGVVGPATLISEHLDSDVGSSPAMALVVDVPKERVFEAVGRDAQEQVILGQWASFAARHSITEPSV